MIAEPYICIAGPNAGELEWMHEIHQGETRRLFEPNGAVNEWQPYADFEREKLRELSGIKEIYTATTDAFRYWVNQKKYGSYRLIGYSLWDFRKDSESNRLLKRAEFLKAVCEKEGVEWLPKQLATGGLVTDDCPPAIEHPCCIMRHQPIPVLERDIVTDGCDRCWCECKCRKTHSSICEKHKPERDYYTKEEVDAKIAYTDKQIAALDARMNEAFDLLRFTAKKATKWRVELISFLKILACSPLQRNVIKGLQLKWVGDDDDDEDENE